MHTLFETVLETLNKAVLRKVSDIGIYYGNSKVRYLTQHTNNLPLKSLKAYIKLLKAPKTPSL